MAGSLKHNLKKFFHGTRGGTVSDSAVELLKMFILPFAKRWDVNASVDDAVGAFFSTDNRKICWGVAKRSFRMLGLHQRVGGMPTKRFKVREVPEGKAMLIVVDRKDQTAKIDIFLDGKELTFLLTRAEFECLKDKVEIRE